MNRRNFLKHSVAAASSVVLTAKEGFPAIIASPQVRPVITGGVQSGDVTSTSGIVWARADRPSKMILEYGLDETMSKPIRLIGPVATQNTDYTARIDLRRLPAEKQIHYRVTFQALDSPRIVSEPVIGTFRTAPASRRNVLVTWGGDVVGQGWGINPEVGGLKIFESIRSIDPDLFIHSGDSIYADNPILAEVKLDDGSTWRNIVTPEKSKVAETLDEFRGNYRYNLLDENLRCFNSQVPILAQWDDHEVRNNWYPGQIIDDNRYSEKRVDVLAARARTAFLDYMPLRYDARDPRRIHRSFAYGPLLDVFMLDERSYRGANSENRQATASGSTAFLGNAQIAWLKQRLLASKARWKVIASDMPLGVIVRDGATAFEACANGNGPALGRELEIAGLLSFLKKNSIRNLIWITTDVHYAAAHYYDPVNAQFTDFDGFWEFIAGPLNAGTFKRGDLDNTFGPQLRFASVPADLKPNRPPSEGLQFFGAIRIDGRSEVATVSLHNISGAKVYAVDLEPSA
jgi:alkaline phosphatase D